MNWPTSQDYNEAIQNASSSFADPGLKSGAVTLNSLGLPVPRSGNFADVYQFKGGDGKMWAVKCFTRKVDGLQQRYLKIDEHLTKAKLPFTVGFKFFEQGIRVRGQWFPLLKMEWVEGFTLNEFVRDNASKPQYLHALVQMWGKLTARLRDADFAHADLQHGNVLLVPGGAPNKLGLKLIDYDGMWVPALAETHSGEIGHPNFQHPLRLKNRLYNADVDRFPHLVVACALRAVMIGGRALWDKFDNGDNLLFKEPDLRDPARAQVFIELWNFRDDVLCTLVGTIALASGEPLRKSPWLDDLLLMDGGPRLTADDEKKVIEMLGVAPHFTAGKAVAAAQAPMQEEFGDFNFDDDLTDEKPAARPQPARTNRKPVREAKKAATKSRMPLYIGGGVLAACLIGGIIALSTGGSGKKNGSNPQELAKNNATDDKPKESIAPVKKDLPKPRANDPEIVSPVVGKESEAPKESVTDPKEVSPIVGKETKPPGDNQIADVVDQPAAGFKELWTIRQKAVNQSVQFTNDGSQIVSAIGASAIRFNSVKDGAALGDHEPIESSVGNVQALAGDVLVINSPPHRVTFWDRKAAKQLFTINDVHDASMRFPVADQLKQILIPHENGIIRVNSTIDGKLIKSIATPLKLEIVGIACSADGSTIALTYPDGSLFARTSAAGAFKHVGRFGSLGNERMMMSLSPGAKYVAYHWRKGLGVIDLATTNAKMRFTDEATLCSVMFVGDRRHLVSLTPALMRFWDVETGKQIAAAAAPGGNALAVSPDGKLAAVSSDEFITLYRLPTANATSVAKQEPGLNQNRLLEFKAKSPVERVVPIPESSALLYACQGDSTLYGINELGATVEIGRHDGPIRALSCSPDGSRAVTGGDDGQLRVWSLGEPRPRDALTGPEGKYLKLQGLVGAYAVLRYHDGLMVFDEANNKKEVVQIGKPGHRVLLGFKRVLERNPKLAERFGPALKDAVWAFDKVLTLQLFEGGTMICEMKSGRIDYTTNGPKNPPPRQSPLSQSKSMFALKQHSAPVLACAISPDNERAVSVGADSLLCEWNLKDGKLLHKFPIPASLAVAYLEGGKAVLLGTSSESAIIVNLEKQKRMNSLLGHQGKVRAVTTTEKHAYTAGDDATVRIWDVTTGALLRTLTNHKSPVLALATMPNGEFVASASRDGQIYLWDAIRGIGRLGGECVSNGDVRTVGFNELSDSLVLGTGAEGGAGTVSYLGLNIENEPAVVTIAAQPKKPDELSKKPEEAPKPAKTIKYSPSTLAYYRFEEGAGTKVINAVNGLDEGTHDALYERETPAAKVPLSGQENQFALKFTGKETMTVNKPFVFHRNSGNATFECWLQVSENNAGALVWSSPVMQDENRFHIRIERSALGCDYRSRNGELHTLLEVAEEGKVSKLQLAPNVWTHIAITRVGTAYRFYKNGTLVHTATDIKPDLPTTIAWTIGGRPGERLKGMVDEIRFSSRALSPAEFLNASGR